MNRSFLINGVGRFRLVPAWLALMVAALVFDQSGGIARAQVNRVLLDADDLAFNIDDSTFHQWIFGAGNKIVSTPEHLEAQLMLAVKDVDRICGLTEAQQRKLILAGRGDGKRFLDRVAGAKREFDRLRNDPEGVNEILEYTTPIFASFQAGLYGEGSLFAKTLGTTLTSDQSERYRKARREQMAFRYKAKVALLLAGIDARVGFTSEQHRQFLDLILEATTPPARPGGPSEENVILLKIARLPEEKVQAIVTPAQWRQVERIFQKARIMEESLRAGGLID